MNTNYTLPTSNQFADLIKHSSSVLKLSLSQIKEKYIDYRLCLLDYIDKDIHDKSIEIRFDKEGYTLTCTFNEDGNCDATFLFPDNDEMIEEFVGYLTEHHDYSFVRSLFMLGNCYLKVKELKEKRSNICLVFFQ